MGLIQSQTGQPADHRGLRGETGIRTQDTSGVLRLSRALPYHSATSPWISGGSNPEPPACKADALPVELETLSLLELDSNQRLAD